MPQPKDVDWLNGYKNDPYMCCLQETHFTSRDTYKLKVRGWKKIFQANGNQKKAGVAILITDKIDFKMKNILRDKEGHYIVPEPDPTMREKGQVTGSSCTRSPPAVT